jgi:outer membrane protein OmpA-like peptidoglycan-associated protein
MRTTPSGRLRPRVVGLLLCQCFLGALLSTLLSACLFINSSTISQTTGTGAPVSATDSDYGILRLTKPNGLTEVANADLLKQCPTQLLTDVQTQLSVRDWLLIVQNYTVAANALCKPPPPPPPPPPPVPPPQAKLILRGVHFDFNKYNIRPGDAAVLDEATASLKEHPNVTVDVNGYCDAIGSEEYNLKLSDNRANAVVDYLVKAGIPANRLMPHGYGKTDFVAPNDTSEGRAQNRRVELVPEQ